MLKQASIKLIRSGEVSRAKGYVVVAMCLYPRGLKSELTDFFTSRLAPDRELLQDFKENEKAYGHEEAFARTDYEARFQLLPIAMEKLKELAVLAKKQDVFLACQCEMGERCHREMLMLLAKERYGTPIDQVFHAYPVFEKRMNEMGLGLSAAP